MQLYNQEGSSKINPNRIIILHQLKAKHQKQKVNKLNPQSLSQLKELFSLILCKEDKEEKQGHIFKSKIYQKWLVKLNNIWKNIMLKWDQKKQ